MEFEKYDDLFGFSRSLLEDDYIDGQHFQLKDKRKAGDHEFVSTFKVAEAKDAKHKLAVEEKVKMTFKEFGGGCVEAKFKNSGVVSVEKKLDFIRRFNGLQNTSVWIAGEINNGALTPFDVGFDHKDDNVRLRATTSTDIKTPRLKFTGTYRVCNNSILGAALNGSATDLLNNSGLGLAYLSSWNNTGLLWGAQWNASVLNGAVDN